MLFRSGRDDAVERFDSSVLEYIEEGPGGGELPFGDSAEGFRGAFALGGGYAATSCSGELVLVDLRRAREAILFERYRVMLGNETSVTQKLMFPEVLVFSADDTALLTERYEEFLALGFEYVRRDENSIEVTGIPADFSVDEIQDLLYDIMDALSDGTQPVEEGRERLAAVLDRKSTRLNSSHAT